MAYATVSDLTAYLGGEAVPDNAATLLDRASRKVDAFLIGAVYDTDDDHMPIRARTIAALRDATCAQVQFWVEIGDLSGTNTGAGWRNVSIGKVSLSRSTGSSSQSDSAPTIAPTVVDILRLAHLIPVSPWMYG